MEQGERSSKRKKVMCFCGLPAKISQAWTDKNPGRRFYGCEHSRADECKFFKWFDEEEPFSWQKEALLEARDKILEKNKEIEKLKKTMNDHSIELQKKK